MRSRLAVVVVAALLTANLHLRAQREGALPVPGERYVGAWSGSWEGAGGSGGLELTLERDKEKGMTGKVSVTGEPTYTATFSSVRFDGAKMTARYEYPPDPNGEVVLTATFEGNGASGAWSLGEKGTTTEVASGSWKVTRKEK